MHGSRCDNYGVQLRARQLAAQWMQWTRLLPDQRLRPRDRPRVAAVGVACRQWPVSCSDSATGSPCARTSETNAYRRSRNFRSGRQAASHSGFQTRRSKFVSSQCLSHALRSLQIAPLPEATVSQLLAGAATPAGSYWPVQVPIVWYAFAPASFTAGESNVAATEPSGAVVLKKVELCRYWSTPFRSNPDLRDVLS